MQKAFFALALLGLRISAEAQGTIQFSNTALPGPTPGTTYEAVIGFWSPFHSGRLPGDVGPGVITAGLFREHSNTPLGTTTFFSGTGVEAAFNYMFNTEPEISVPGISPGQTGRFYVGVWWTSQGSFATAEWRAQSDVFTSRPLGGPNPTPSELPFTTPVTTFQSFTFFIIPEPAVSVPSLISLGALALRRCRR